MPRFERSRRLRTYTNRARVSDSSYRQHGDFSGKATSINQKYLLAAGWVIGAQAIANASKFSERIGPSTYVVPGDADNEVVVITDGDTAPNALPFEAGIRHPLNYPNQVAAAVGAKRPFGFTPKRAYMTNALRAKQQEALEAYAQSLDELVDQGLKTDDL